MDSPLLKIFFAIYYDDAKIFEFSKFVSFPVSRKIFHSPFANHFLKVTDGSQFSQFIAYALSKTNR